MALTDMGDAPDPKRTPNDSGDGKSSLAGRPVGERGELVLRRERDMIELRIGGASIAAIAEHYSLADSTVSVIVKRGLLRMKRDRMELREQAHARLDKIVRAYYEDAVGMPRANPDGGEPIPRVPDAKAAAVVVMAVREQIKLGQLDKLDDGAPSDTPEERADALAATFERYLDTEAEAAADEQRRALSAAADEQAAVPPVDDG